MVTLPTELETPFRVEDQVASKVMLDLTIYLVGPTEEEFDFLFDLYDQISSPEHRVKYKISELPYWVFLDSPKLTLRGREASSAGKKRPYFEPVRQRIQEGRAFEASFWDGRSIGDQGGSWSFSCKCMHLRSSGLHSFVRLLLPIGTDLGLMASTAAAIADNVEFYSGHAGLAFVYDPRLQLAAFDHIYAQSRRFWGVEIEDLNRTLPLMCDGIKGVNWLTLLGNRLAITELNKGIESLSTVPDLKVTAHKNGTIFTIGTEPVVGDQHRPDESLSPYEAVANALGDLILTEHDDFPGQRFADNGNTVGWIRRFIEPEGWR